MADCAQLSELYDAYALGALNGAELAALEEHLARKCPVCTPGVEQARALVANLTYLAPSVEPPAALRAKILQTVNAEAAALAKNKPLAQPAPIRQTQPRGAWIPAWAWTAAAALVLFAGYTTRQMSQSQREVATLERRATLEQQRSRELDSERDRYLEALQIISDAGTKQMQLKPVQATMPPVAAYWNPKKGLVLASDNMPAMASGRTLQLWVVPRQGSPISVGIFHPNAAGQVLMVMPAAEAMNMARALAISDEPAGGSPQPTTTPEWVGPVT